MKANFLGLCTAFLLNYSVVHVVATTKGIPHFEPRNSTIVITSTAPSTSPSPLGYAKKLRAESFNTLKTVKNLSDASIAPKLLDVISCAPTVLHATSRSSVRYVTAGSGEKQLVATQPPITERPSVTPTPSKETEAFHGMKTTKSITAEIAPKMIASSVAPTVSSPPSRISERNAATIVKEKLYVYLQLPWYEQSTVSPSPFYESKANRGRKQLKMVYPQIAPKILASSVAPTVSPAPSKTDGKYAASYRSGKLLIFPKTPYTEKPSVSPLPSKASVGVKRMKDLPLSTSKSTNRDNHNNKNRPPQKDVYTGFPSVSSAPSVVELQF
jgi:hypothetical protein